MDVRAQVASVFHLDKCLGCHTCSVVCKNLWTDRSGAEHMWWNNVETRPGVGYPPLWEDQERHRGGWALDGGALRLRLGGRGHLLAHLFHAPRLPTLDDQYEPWRHRHEDLLAAPPGDDLPTARAVSRVTGRPVEVESGPAWDDDLAGSGTYAAADPNLAAVPEDERRALGDLERLAFFHLPRTCNHCANPACAAACPSGAVYKRAEDGVVLVSRERCRGWRMCVPACPYKKTFHSWSEGKSEKCIGCYPRLESGDAPACFHACVGRIRYQGVLLYDADLAAEALRVPDRELVGASRRALLDPADDGVAEAARAAGISAAVLDAARRSPALRFVKRWRMALPLHPEFRTFPMVFYVPPLSPARRGAGPDGAGPLAAASAQRLPVPYLASLFAAGDEDAVRAALAAQVAVRAWRRAATAGDPAPADAARLLAEAGLDAGTAAEIHRLTALAPLGERVVRPPLSREAATERTPGLQGAAGLASREGP